ncbi:MAG: hypothetical protein M1829_001879 [Trizodia sp. TS-e1964]|nr:MAG: hypothetical protein M1829_001879 [Trizodia sp. TS-e1964]
MFSDDSSPDSVSTAVTTPLRSPIRTHGPMLLPRIRPQDQNIEPSASLDRNRKQPLSNTFNPPGSASLASTSRRAPSPGDCGISPTSVTSLHSSRFSSSLSSPISLTSSHSRRPSGDLDVQLLGKYGFPTYRQMPNYIAPGMYSSSSHGASTFVSPPPSISPPMSHYPVQELSLPLDLQYDGGAQSTSTLMDYLTGPNPTPSLVRQVNANVRAGAHNAHFWWDIRNLRSWDDFNLQTLACIPGLLRLLKIELPDSALPTPVVERQTLQPESEGALHQLCTDFYAAKVNAALRVAQGQKHMYMRAESQLKERRQPQFVSSYKQDAEKTLLGDSRGRVVGLVKSFDRWNTGMRAEAPHRKVEYLAGLAHLHHYMREHSCRYGFIITEIELVCVRAGTESVPNFGSLELATIQLSDTGFSACLALWYLHMLAKEQPLPGQYGWRLEVGGAAACTRQKCLVKDAWIPEPQTAEKREAKRLRGWVLPTEPLHRREVKKRWHR